MLRIYRPLNTQKAGSLAAAPAHTPNRHDKPSNGDSEPPPPVDNASGEKDKAAKDDKHIANCLLVDDNEINLKVSLHAMRSS